MATIRVTSDAGTTATVITATPAKFSVQGGLRGPRGHRGDQGDVGVGVPTGGSAGQILAKKTIGNYDTEWVTMTGGEGGVGASADTPYEDLFVNDQSQLAQWAAGLADGDMKTAAMWMTVRPMVFWSGIEWDPDGLLVKDVVERASAVGKTAQLSLYSIPVRDNSGYSGGGATSADAYRAWIDKVRDAIGPAPVIIVLEADAVGQADLLTEEQRIERYELLTYAVNTLKGANPHCRVYIDAGNPSWLAVNDLAARLAEAGVADADGFSLNVSNFQSDESNIKYGQNVLVALGAFGSSKGFVIDSGRNGNPVQEGTFNPPNRRFGRQPQFGSTGVAGLHGWLWVKGPGESDGESNYNDFNGNNVQAPAAGQVFPLYLWNPDVLVHNTDSPDLGKGSGMLQRTPATYLIPYNYDTILERNINLKAPLADPNFTGSLDVVNATLPAYVKVQGKADAFNASGVELWDELGNIKWQLTQAADGTFKISHFDGDWSMPMQITAADAVAFIGAVTAPSLAAAIDTAVAGTSIKFKGITVDATGAGTGTINIPFTNATHTMVLATATQTLTNKRVSPRIQLVGGTTATLTPAGDTTDEFVITALSINTTIMNPSGTPTHGQRLLVRIKDDGTARTLAWDTLYRPVGVTLPTTTVVGKVTYVGCVYNTTELKWDVIAVSQEA